MKKTNKNRIIAIGLISIIMLTFMSTNIFAVDADYYQPSSTGTATTFNSRAGIILGWIQFIGMLVSVVVLSIIGIKYIFTSVEGKAEYKKAMLPFIVGCFLLVGTPTVLKIVAGMADPTPYTTYTWFSTGDYVMCDQCGPKSSKRLTRDQASRLVNTKCSVCQKVISKINYREDSTDYTTYTYYSEEKYLVCDNCHKEFSYMDYFDGFIDENKRCEGCGKIIKSIIDYYD